MPTSTEQIAQLEAAIAGLEAQRAILGDAIVNLAIAPLHQQLKELRKSAASQSLMTNDQLPISNL